MSGFIKQRIGRNFLTIITISNTVLILILILFQKGIRDVLDLIGIFITGFISYLVYKSQLQKDRFDYTMQRPLLNFVCTPHDGWVILNVGNGPALNIRFMGKSRTSWGQSVIGYAIPPNMALIINPEIVNYGAALAVYYKDLFENEYMVQCEGDTNSIVCKRGGKDWNEDLFKKIHTDVRRSNNLHLTTLK